MKGFTLIELLVVVLIIGVLASIAVPQYQRAVDEAYVTEAIVQGRALQKALVLYYQSTGKFATSDFEALDFEIPEKLHWSYFSTAGYKTLTRQRSGVYFEINRYHADSYSFWCVVVQSNQRGKKLCESLAQLDHSGSLVDYYLIHDAPLN